MVLIVSNESSADRQLVEIIEDIASAMDRISSALCDVDVRDRRALIKPLRHCQRELELVAVHAEAVTGQVEDDQEGDQGRHGRGRTLPGDPDAGTVVRPRQERA